MDRLTNPQRLIVGYLDVINVATEFEIAMQLSNDLNIAEVDLVPQVSQWLIQLKALGLAWAGPIYNNTEPPKAMWVSALTKAGRTKAKEIKDAKAGTPSK